MERGGKKKNGSSLDFVGATLFVPALRQGVPSYDIKSIGD
jgi:hypothetical protein